MLAQTAVAIALATTGFVPPIGTNVATVAMRRAPLIMRYDDARRAEFRKNAWAAHPDRPGGSVDAFQKLVEANGLAMEEARTKIDILTVGSALIAACMWLGIPLPLDPALCFVALFLGVCVYDDSEPEDDKRALPQANRGPFTAVSNLIQSIGRWSERFA